MGPGMPKVLALLVTTTLVSGCALRGEYRGVAYAVDGTAIVAGLAMAMADEPTFGGDDTGGSDDSGAAGSLVALPLMATNEVGVALALAGAVGMAFNYTRNQGLAPTDDALAAAMADDDLAPLPAPPGADPEAVRMTKQARRAALSGQCNVARRLASRVQHADERYYATVFRSDPPLRVCL